MKSKRRRSIGLGQCWWCGVVLRGHSFVDTVTRILYVNSGFDRFHCQLEIRVPHEEAQLMMRPWLRFLHVLMMDNNDCPGTAQRKREIGWIALSLYGWMPCWWYWWRMVVEMMNDANCSFRGFAGTGGVLLWLKNDFLKYLHPWQCSPVIIIIIMRLGGTLRIDRHSRQSHSVIHAHPFGICGPSAETIEYFGE